MIRRRLLRLLGRAARRRDQRIVRVDDLLTMAAKDSRLRVDRDGYLTYADPTMKRWPWTPDVGTADDEYVRDIGDWYLRGSDE